ncbi:MIP family channel protein [Desulfofundulus kuznetsovii DSM 6115]|uniref:MIP family channel protein n=1 Tax=Desulfofundulus kuznetsovii (strain DSM 6115 / VKM B-1805 / 17) TaxID=760568 RepID=A0AAU8PKT2_DESK7|nr:MIP family channel protein [Desulfofundulus kuznetsovii DSM 6115]
MSTKKLYAGELIAEYIGSFILIFFGASSVATLVLNGAQLGLWEISILWGMAVTIAIYITGGVSGTHINPAVTIALAAFRGFPWNKVLPYSLVQVAGCFTGAAASYLLFRNGFAQWEATQHVVRGSLASVKTAGIFSTYPASYLNNLEAFLVEMFITAMLLMVIFAVSDPKNTVAPRGNFGPLIVGLTITTIGGCFGSLTGFAMNPARDFGPKLFAFLAGWGNVALPAPGNYFWVPILGPIAGALAGGFVYEKFIAPYLALKASSLEIQEEVVEEENAVA